MVEPCPLVHPLEVRAKRLSRPPMALVGACAAELRFIEIEREEVRASVNKTSGGWGSDTRNTYRARVPLSMERM
jgi:hypothetical protein